MTIAARPPPIIPWYTIRLEYEIALSLRLRTEVRAKKIAEPMATITPRYFVISEESSSTGPGSFCSSVSVVWPSGYSTGWSFCNSEFFEREIKTTPTKQIVIPIISTTRMRSPSKIQARMAVQKGFIMKRMNAVDMGKNVTAKLYSTVVACPESDLSTKTMTCERGKSLNGFSLFLYD